MGQVLEPAKRQKLSEIVAEKVIGLILDEGLEPGYKLPTETELSKLLGVGRSSIREAIQNLANAGVVTVKQGKGTFVNRVSLSTLLDKQSYLYQLIQLEPNEIRDIMDVRRLLETEIARLAARFASKDDIATLSYYHQQHAEVHEHPIRGVYRDIDFHLALARITRNCMLPKLLHFIRTMFIKYSPIISTSGVDVHLILNQHQQILNAVVNHDEDAAVKTMLEHLNTSEYAILSNFEKLVGD